MKEIKYKITKGERDYPEQFQEVNGFLLFELFGYQWATHHDVPEHDWDCWIVDEVSTGFELESGLLFSTPEKAKEWAYNYLLKKGEHITRFHIEKAKLKLANHDLQKMSEG